MELHDTPVSRRHRDFHDGASCCERDRLRCVRVSPQPLRFQLLHGCPPLDILASYPVFGYPVFRAFR